MTSEGERPEKALQMVDGRYLTQMSGKLYQSFLAACLEAARVDGRMAELEAHDRSDDFLTWDWHVRVVYDRLSLRVCHTADDLVFQHVLRDGQAGHPAVSDAIGAQEGDHLSALISVDGEMLSVEILQPSRSCCLASLSWLVRDSLTCCYLCSMRFVPSNRSPRFSLCRPVQSVRTEHFQQELPSQSV